MQNAVLNVSILHFDSLPIVGKMENVNERDQLPCKEESLSRQQRSKESVRISS